jgi:hypothetical protein
MIDLLPHSIGRQGAADKCELIKHYVRDHWAEISKAIGSIAVTRNHLLNFLNKNEFRDIHSKGSLGNFLGQNGLNLPYIDFPDKTRKFILVAVGWSSSLTASERHRAIQKLNDEFMDLF